MRILAAFGFATATIALSGCGLFRTPEPSSQAQVTVRVADAALQSGAPDMALRVAQLVLEKQPNNVGALVAKGDALYALGATEQARGVYDLAVAADDSDVAAQIGLGRTLVRSDPREAEKRFLAAIARQPDNVTALNNLGIARDMQGRHADAQQAYRQALAVAPDAADVKTNLGLSLALSGQGSQAVHLLQPIATAPEAIPIKRANLAVALAKARDVGPSGPVKEHTMEPATAQFDMDQVAIDPGPITAVQSRPLIEQPSPRQMMSVPLAGLSVEMGSLDTEQAAFNEWQKLRTRWADLLLGREPIVVPGVVRDRTYWRLRTGGFPSGSAAAEFCARMRSTGPSCWTVVSGTDS